MNICDHVTRLQMTHWINELTKFLLHLRDRRWRCTPQVTSDISRVDGLSIGSCEKALYDNVVGVVRGRRHAWIKMYSRYCVSNGAVVNHCIEMGEVKRNWCVFVHVRFENNEMYLRSCYVYISSLHTYLLLGDIYIGTTNTINRQRNTKCTRIH